MNKPLLTLIALVAFAWVMSLNILGVDQEKTISLQASHLMRLERIIEKQGALIQWHSHRITQLERPNEPVYPPRNPGRLGQIGSAN